MVIPHILNVRIAGRRNVGRLPVFKTQREPLTAAQLLESYNGTQRGYKPSAIHTCLHTLGVLENNGPAIDPQLGWDT